MPVKTKIKQSAPHTDVLEIIAQARGYSMRHIHFSEFQRLSSEDLRYKDEILIVVQGRSLTDPDCFCGVVLPIDFYKDIESFFALARDLARTFSKLPLAVG